MISCTPEGAKKRPRPRTVKCEFILLTTFHTGKKGTQTYLLSESNQLPKLKMYVFLPLESQEQISSAGRRKKRVGGGGIWA